MEIKKSLDAKYQLHVWSKLLEGRISLQKVILASRDLEKAARDDDDNDDDHKQVADDSTVKAVSKLLTSLVKLRDTYRNKSQFNHGDSEAEVQDPDRYSSIDDRKLQSCHDDYTDIRNSLIDKWYEKTKIGIIPKKGYTALELPTLQLINNALKDKERLIKRTQIDRSSQSDNIAHPEIFNDDDFYHHLLKEVISKEENRKWAELQRTKYKLKRRAETRATKGRKIKKDIIPKLVNFMAPLETSHDPIRGELLKSLFGGGVVNG